MCNLFCQISKMLCSVRPILWRSHILSLRPCVLYSCLGRFYNSSGGDQRKKPQRPAGGGRFLTDPARVFDYNNWDNVVWDEEQEAEARSKVAETSSVLVDSEMQEKYENEANKFWDQFYMQHQNRFFKDRHWLFTEFPELAPQGVPENIPLKVVSGLDANIAVDSASSTQTATNDKSYDSRCETPDSHDEGKDPSINCELTAKMPDGMDAKADMPAVLMEGDRHSVSEHLEQEKSSYVQDIFPGAHGTTRILEVGCGVGNTVFPVLQTNDDPGVFVYCCDFSATAIQLVTEHADYCEQRCHAFVCDVTDENSPVPFPDESLDIVILIFVLSAVHPEKMQMTIQRLARFLKPGGLIVFRDYGRYDLAQLRFKKGRCLAENFYVRGDGTRVYFFTQEELRELFTKSNLVEEQNLIDRRLQVNRGRQLKMYRVWIQCKYRKPLNTS